jgi:hypothetical protein
MTEEKWQDTKSMVKDKFKILEEKKEPVELKTGLDSSQRIGEKEIIIFDSPIGKIKFEYVVKPVILDKKEHYSKRMGTSASTEYVLSDSEYVRRLDIFKQKDGVWEKMEANAFGA